MALVPRLSDDAVIGRVYALSEFLYAGAAGIGALVAPVLISALGAGGSLVAVGLAFGVCGALAWRACVQLDAQQEVAGRVRELLRQIRFLAPLPLPELERLVRSARPVTVMAGSDVIRAGERGEEFYVIESGVAEIVEAGVHQGPGAGFGEIALLREVPRTATVRALSDLHLWVIVRSAFVAAVTAHGDASRLADIVVAEHLGPGPTPLESRPIADNR